MIADPNPRSDAEVGRPPHLSPRPADSPGRLVAHALPFLAAFLAVPVAAQVPGQSPLNESTLRERGQNVIPLYDGWFPNEEGGYTLCFGYFNLNTEQALDIPLGPSNRLEPAEYDGVQPTHFDPVPDPDLTSKYRHYWCVFSVDVPADFGDRDVVWTLASQGNELEVPGSLNPAYVLDEPTSPGRNAVAPLLRLGLVGTPARGRRGVWAGPVRAGVGVPVTLLGWASHEAPGTWLGWTKHQGPGGVAFDTDEIRLETPEGVAEVTATFDAPGRYVVRVQAINDREIPSNPTYGFEFHCCWTNGYIIVEVAE